MTYKLILNQFASSFCQRCCGNMSQEMEENALDRKPIVQIENGKIKGSVLESRLGVLFNAFRGIRYGKAPIGDLRFKVNILYAYKLLL